MENGFFLHIEGELMSPSTETSPLQRPSDPLWGVLVGTYVGLLTAPLVAFGAAHLGLADGELLYPVSVVWLAVAVVGLGWLAGSRRPGLAVRLGATRLRWLPAVMPVACALVIYALGGFALPSRIPGIGGPVILGGGGAMIIGLFLGVMARTRHADAVLDGVDIACEFSAGWPRRARRRARRFTGGAAVVTVAAFFGGLLADVEWLRIAGQILFPAVIGSLSQSDGGSYTVSTAGLEQQKPVARRLFQWDAFEGYSRTDDALVLHRPWLVDTRFALADLDDPDAVETALARHLPRT